MPYTLQIHHIDVDQGDSTLILVIDEANNNIVRSVLIDGGLATASRVVDGVVTGQNVARLGTMIASHFDKDHYWGLTDLLLANHTLVYDDVDIYDRGEWGNVDQFGAVMGRKNDFSDYLAAVARVNTRTRLTAQVVASRSANIPNGWNGAHWLVDQDIFSFNGGLTRMTCVVANKWVNGQVNLKYVEGSQAIDDNPFSLGFLIRHNNFRYFTAGDLSTAQEESVGEYLSPNGADNRHVCAIKASHHGASKSSSAYYLQTIRPRVVFFSAGLGNTYNHPSNKALTNIENSPKIQYYYLSSCGSQQASATLLGCNQGVNQVTQNVMARVAGTRPRANPPANRGHVKLRVTNAQSGANPHQFSVTYYDQDNGGLLTVNHTC